SKENGDMVSVGYARVSSIGQELDVQIGKLAMCERVFKEKQSAIDADRPELKRCLDYVREGDTLVVTKIDRLARSTSDLYRIVSALADKGVAFKVIDDPSIDYLTPIDRFLEDYGVPSARYVDDIYIFVESVEATDHLLREVIPALRSYDLVLNEAKS